MKKILVTGGAGFIGSHFVDQAMNQGDSVVLLDALTYSGLEQNFSHWIGNDRFRFIHESITNYSALVSIFRSQSFDAVVHFAAESHVDRSITNPESFIETNVLGTVRLLRAAQLAWSEYESQKKQSFRFVHVSTDEVFGALGDEGSFTEQSRYEPNSPYSASKASSDHFVRAWYHTYGLPTVITNCSNNYGPRQFPEKLIPHMILSAVQGKPLPVYGNGKNVRDWIQVEDHAQGVMLALKQGRVGESYCFGGRSEMNNLAVVQQIVSCLDQIRPRSDGLSYQKQIQFVTDRPGHDFRYAIDDTRAETELGFSRKTTNFSQGLKSTVEWYLNNLDWCQAALKKVGGDARFDWSRF
jgi:dTDP-glucose 4,6-dehydratase